MLVGGVGAIADPGDLRDLVLARHCIANGRSQIPVALDWCAYHVLGIRSGSAWREALSTVLAGNWVRYRRGETYLECTISDMRAEAQVLHRELTPLWRRKTGHQRILLLDTPLGDGITLYDLVDASPPVEEVALGSALPDDPRLRAVLIGLTPSERKVALAWAHWQVASWAEAAVLSGADDPIAFGERVRRKLKRLGAEYTRRAASSGDRHR